MNNGITQGATFIREDCRLLAMFIVCITFLLLHRLLPSRSLSVSCTLRQFLLAFVFQLHNPGPIALLIGYLMLSV